MIIYERTKYRYKDNKWQFFVEIGDVGFLKENTWYQVINKYRIKDLNKYLREQKLKRICNDN